MNNTLRSVDNVGLTNYYVELSITNNRNVG